MMKMIFKKCIRIVKGISNLTSTMYANFDIRYSYNMCSIYNGYDQNEMQIIFASIAN